MVEPSHTGWLEHPLIREAINRRVSGSSGGWPLDWFECILNGRRFARALSIGCGTGALERDLVRRGICGRVEAFDGSIQSLLLAVDASRKNGMDSSIRYFAADFNRIELPTARYEAVFFHQSLHHVERLEHLLGQVAAALVPGGMVYLDEFIGPSRFAWTEHSISSHRTFFDSLPRVARNCVELPLPIQKHDPSEAVRSDEIVKQLERGFEIQFRRDYGGNLLSVLYPFLVGPVDAELVRSMLAAEEEEMGRGVSYHSVIVAQPVNPLSATLERYGDRSHYRRWRRMKFYRETVAPLAFRVKRKLGKIVRLQF